MQIRHPATYSASILAAIYDILRGRGLTGGDLLDPMAGTGKIAELFKFGFTGRIYCNDIEEEWCAASGVVWTHCDAANLSDVYLAESFDVIVTSPTYGNRMADNYLPEHGRENRRTYVCGLGRRLSDGNTGTMQFGPAYCAAHQRIWAEQKRLLRKDGILLVNVSDHIRRGKVIGVVDWHTRALSGLGFTVSALPVATPRYRRGANSRLRVEHEVILIAEVK